MPTLPPANSVKDRRQFRSRYSAPVRLLCCFLLVGAATLFGGSINRGLYLWVANGVLLAYLLLAPRKSWPSYLGAAVLAEIAVAPFMHSNWQTVLFYLPHDTLEVAIAAFLLRRRPAELPAFTNTFYLLRFIACALLAAPLVIAALYALLSSLLFHINFGAVFTELFIGDSLGIMVTTPACVAIFRSGLRQSVGDQKNWLIVVPVFLAVAVVLTQSKIAGAPFLFPILVLVLLRLGLGWASFITLATAAIGAWSTVHGIGPFSDSALSSPPPGVRLQIFLVSIMVVLYGVSIVIENLRKTERRLHEIATLHTLVAENSRDVIVVIDREGRRSFISSPANSIWGGWSREDVLASDTLDLVHPDDRPHVGAIIKSLFTGKDGDLIEFRIEQKDGHHVWVEANLRTVRDPISQIPTGVLANIREVTERKHAEQKREHAFHEIEMLSITDPLTGLANRRRFDTSLANEWRRALREQNPLSLLLIDADHFKDYNDTYGHPGGDTCLKEIADAVLLGATRSSDLAARIGGEEFAVLLPNSSGAGARSIANRICDELRSRCLPHVGSSNGIVTVSVGCATVVPQAGQTFSFLVDLADQALYSAKHAGRNCVYPPTREEDNDALPSQQEHVGLA